MPKSAQGWQNYAKNIKDADDNLKAFLSSEKEAYKTKDLATYTKYLNAHNKTLDLTTLKTKAWAFAKNMAVNAGIALASFLVTKLIKVADDWIHKVDRMEEQLETLKEEYKEIETELSSVKGELKTVTDRITELQSKGTLTFTEKEEYDNLAKQSNELQRQNKLLEEQLKIKNKEKNDTFVSTMNEDSKGEVNTTDENGNQIKLTGKDKMKYWDDFAIVNYESAKARGDDDATDTYAQKMMDKYEEYAERAEGISYIPSPDTEDERKVNEWLDFIEDYQDRMMIALGSDGAKESAFNRVVDNWQFDEVVQGLQDLGEEGKVTAEMLNDPKYDAFIQKLVELGVIDTADNLDEIALAFNNVGTEAETAGKNTNENTR